MTTAILLGVLLMLFALNTPIMIAVGTAAFAALLIKGGINPMVAIQRIYAGADSFPLLAVPLFLVAGQFMSAGGISRRIVRLADTLVGHLPGGLAIVSVVSAMFFAGVSGSAAADTAAVGSILIPSMVARGYSAPFAGAVQAAAGSIGIIIPPSIPMIVFGSITGASIGQLFAAGILPGFLMGLSLSLYCIYHGIAEKKAAQKNHNPTNNKPFNPSAILPAMRDALWSLGAPIIILGGILSGIFTATESAGIAVIYAFCIGHFAHKELQLKAIPSLLLEAGVTSGVIMSIIAVAALFGWLMAIERIPAMLAQGLITMGGSGWTLLLLVNLLLLVVGTLLETTAALILITPILLPLLPQLGISLTHLGIIIVMNLAIGMLTPPMGVCLMVSSGIARVPLATMARAVLPFLVVLLIDLMIVCFV
ncbi:MAG: TRAP transporter large permease [Pseudomonadota bacterium]